MNAVASSVEAPLIHYIKRPGHNVHDIVILLALIPEAQRHFSYVSLMNREGRLLIWNDEIALELEMRRGQFIELRRNLLMRKYLFVSPVGMVAQVEDLDAAVYRPYRSFLERSGQTNQ
jgi:hypothetical protein